MRIICLLVNGMLFVQFFVYTCVKRAWCTWFFDKLSGKGEREKNKKKQNPEQKKELLRAEPLIVTGWNVYVYKE